MSFSITNNGELVFCDKPVRASEVACYVAIALGVLGALVVGGIYGAEALNYVKETAHLHEVLEIGGSAAAGTMLVSVVALGALNRRQREPDIYKFNEEK